MTVTNHGGVVIPNVNVQNLYLGSDWSTNSTLFNQTGAIEGFSNYLVHSSYMDMLGNAGYGVGRGSFTSGWIANYSINKAYYLNDTTIQADLQQQISSSSSHILGFPNANTLYVVYVEPGVAIKNWTQTSQTNFLGYHGAFSGVNYSGNRVDIHYAVIAYPGGYNFTARSQGFNSNFDDMTKVTSHEIAEAVTDPNVNYRSLTWYDDQKNGEIGDIANNYTIRLGGYVVQPEVAQNDSLIYPSGWSYYFFTGGTASGFSSVASSAAVAPTTAVITTHTVSNKNPKAAFVAPKKTNTPSGHDPYDPTVGSTAFVGY